MSSPNLNNLIIVGCLLSYSGVIILGLDSSLTSEPAFRYICTVKAWVLMAGFTLSFGSMFSKTWRVHSIFTNVQLNKKVRKKINGIVLLFFLWSLGTKMFQQDKTPEFWFCVGTFPFLDLYEENVHVLTIIIFLSHICVEKLLKPIWESLKVLSSLKKIFSLISEKTPLSLFQVMKDSQLFLVVGVLLTIDITIMTTWHLADPFYREIQQLKSYVSLETLWNHDWSFS